MGLPQSGLKFCRGFPISRHHLLGDFMKLFYRVCKYGGAALGLYLTVFMLTFMVHPNKAIRYLVEVPIDCGILVSEGYCYQTLTR